MSRWTKTGCANDSRQMHTLATRSPIITFRVELCLLALILCASLAWPSCAHGALRVAVETTPSGELFPAIELSQQALAGDAATGTGLLRLRLSGDSQPRDIRITLITEGLRAPTVLETRLDGELVLRPRLDWNTGQLQNLTAPRRQSLLVKVEGRGFEAIEHRVDVRVHPLDEALYFVREGSAQIDLGWTFAAWVDPQHPVIDELLTLAGITEFDRSMPATDRGARMRQVRAIWAALEKRGLRYSNDGAGIAQGPSMYSQRVRLLSSTWNDRVANCLDGSVLIASAMERLGIRSLLVLVPGHAFVGFYTDPQLGEVEFLETTLLGQRARSSRADGSEGVLGIEKRAATGFEAAREAGRASYRNASPRLDGKHRPNYAIIDISTARTYGIMPLAVGRGDSIGKWPVVSLPAVDQPIQHSPSP